MHPSDGTLRRSLDEPVAVDAASREHMATLRALRGAGSAHERRCRERSGRCCASPESRASTWLRHERRLAHNGGSSDGWRAGSQRAREATSSTRRPGEPSDGRGRHRCCSERGARGHGWRPGFPEPLPAAAVRGRPGHGIGRPLARRAHELRTVTGGTSIAYAAREPDAAAAGAAAGIAAPVVSDLPAGTADAPQYAVVSGGVVTFTFTQELAQAAAARAGGQLPAMPAGLDGSTLSVIDRPSRRDVVRRRSVDASSTAAALPSGPAFIVVETPDADGHIDWRDRAATRELPALRARHPRRRRIRDSRTRRPDADHPRPDTDRSRQRLVREHQRGSGPADRRFDRAGQRRDLATQWRRVRDRRNVYLERGARRRPIDTLTAAVAPPSPAPSEDGRRYGRSSSPSITAPSVALSGLTMVVPRGEVFGFLGPNGSGKTTAVKLLLGLSRPTGGEAWVLGRPRRAIARPGAGSAICPELFRYQGWLSAARGARRCTAGSRASLDAEWPAQISGSAVDGRAHRACERQGRDVLQRDAAASRARRRAARRPGAGDPRRAHIGARPGRPGRYPDDHPPPPGSWLRGVSQLAPPRRGGADLRPRGSGLRRSRPGDRKASTSCSAAAASACGSPGSPTRGEPRSPGAAGSAEHDGWFIVDGIDCGCGARPRRGSGCESAPGCTPWSRCARRSRSASSPSRGGARRDGSADHRAAHDPRGRPAEAVAGARGAHADRHRTHRLGVPAPDHAHQSRRQPDPRRASSGSRRRRCWCSSNSCSAACSR